MNCSTIGMDWVQRLDYALSSESNVIDIGGNCGNFAAAIRALHDCKVDVYEPIPELGRLMKYRFSGDPLINVHLCGVSDHEGEQQYNVAGFRGDATSPWAQGNPIVAKVIDANDLPCATLLKLNCEGGEYSILPRLMPEVSRFKYIQIQFHDLFPDSAQAAEDIRQRLLKTHDMMWTTGPWAFESWTRKGEQ